MYVVQQFIYSSKCIDYGNMKFIVFLDIHAAKIGKLKFNYNPMFETLKGFDMCSFA